MHRTHACCSCDFVAYFPPLGRQCELREMDQRPMEQPDDAIRERDGPDI